MQERRAPRTMKVLLVRLLNIGLLDGLLGVAGGCWDDDITSGGLDHSRKFPAKHQ